MHKILSYTIGALAIFGVISILAIMWTWEPEYEADTESDYHNLQSRVMVGELKQDKVDLLYNYACEFHLGQHEGGYCPDSPAVIFTPLSAGYYGFYKPESSITWLNSAFAHQRYLSTFGESIAVHEMVHFLAFFDDILQDDVDACREENLAWFAANTWLEENGRPQDVNPEWWEWYDYCDGPNADAKEPLKEQVRRIIPI